MPHPSYTPISICKRMNKFKFIMKNCTLEKRWFIFSYFVFSFYSQNINNISKFTLLKQNAPPSKTIFFNSQNVSCVDFGIYQQSVTSSIQKTFSRLFIFHHTGFNFCILISSIRDNAQYLQVVHPD